MADFEAVRLRRYRCNHCGYGATSRRAPEQCPMCRQASWEEEGWSPLTSLTGDLDPATAPMARELNGTEFLPGVPFS